MTKLEKDMLESAAHVAEESKADVKAKRKRNLLLLTLGSTVLTLGTIYGMYDHYYASWFVSTDNAYTAAEIAQVTSAIPGIVREVRVTDTQSVKRGDIVMLLDDTDAALALAQAEAELGRAERRVRGYVANDTSLLAQVESRVSEERRAEAQLIAARADLERARIDIERREGPRKTDESRRFPTSGETRRQTVSCRFAAGKRP